MIIRLIIRFIATILNSQLSIIYYELERAALHSEYRCHCSEDGSEELDQPPPLITLRDRVFLDFIKF